MIDYLGGSMDTCDIIICVPGGGQPDVGNAYNSDGLHRYPESAGEGLMRCAGEHQRNWREFRVETI